MGKKSLTKSTTKKKAKKSVKKKPGDVAVNSTSQETLPEVQSNLAPPLDRQFTGWETKKQWKPKLDKSLEKNFAAPPAVKAKGKAATKIRSLLSMTFDLEKSEKLKTEQNEQKTSKKPAPKPAAKAKKPAQQGPVSSSDLIKLKFDSWQPEKPFQPETDKQKFSAPPAFEGIDKSMLLKHFDLKTVDAPKPVAPEAAHATTPEEQVPVAEEQAPVKEEQAPVKKEKAKREPVPVEALLKMSFDGWQPEKLYVPETGGYEHNFSAPPAFEGLDKSLILKQFDLSIPDAPKSDALEAPFEKTFDADTVKPGSHETSEPQIEKIEETTEAEKPEITEAPETAPFEKTFDADTVKPGSHETSEPQIEKTGETMEAEKPETTEAPEAAPFEKTVDADTVKPESHETSEPQIEKPAAPPEPPEDIGGDGGDDGGGYDGGGMPPEPPKEPLLGTGTKILIAALAFIFLILIASSATNMRRYYIEETRQGIEIWRGTFSPMNRTKIVALPGAQPPAEEQPHYDRRTVMTIAHDYFMGNAREMMQDRQEPADLRGIRLNLENAARFAVTPSQRNEAVTRLNQIDFTMLIYRADVAAEEHTREGYELALKYLNQAGELDINSPGRRRMLDTKIEQIKTRLIALEPTEPVKPAEPAEPMEPAEPVEPREMEKMESEEMPENNS
jgi:hypothetical protein